MKIKFEIKLTASPALLTVLSALVGISVKADEKGVLGSESQQDFEKMVARQESQQTDQAPAPEAKKRASRAAAPKVDPIPNKIVPPDPQKAEEVSENLPPRDESEDEGAPAITIEDVRGFGGSLIQKNDVKFRPLVMAVLQAHGASKFSELDPSEFAGTLADLKALQ